MNDSAGMALAVGEGNERLDLQLHRYPFEGAPGPWPKPAPRPRAPHAVLLLHGGNTSRDTFLYPNGGLSRFLTERGYDVWLLDWRGSPYVVDPLIVDNRPHLGGSADAERRLFALDVVAEQDLPAALRKIRTVIGDAELSIVGHCLGAGATAMATARGLLEEFGVRKLVLSTMGLFYEVPWNGWIKAEDFLIERVIAAKNPARGISPTRTPWPKVVEEAYAKWPSPWLPSPGNELFEMLRRLAFMFGQPYSLPKFHADVVDSGKLLHFFGHLHLGLYMHVSQLVRRGYAARFDEPDVIDRPRLGRIPNEESGVPEKSDLVPRHFRNKKITLISAGQNHLWHREAIDLMHDWLRNVPCQSVKHVFTDYNIQELMWGVKADREVYPKIEEGLR